MDRKNPYLGLFTIFGLLCAQGLGQAGTTFDAPPFEYVEVGGERGLGNYAMQHGTGSNVGGGIAAADFDDDGDIDIFVPTANGTPDQLYRNFGNGMFQEIAAAAGLSSTAGNRCALWFDYDGDGDLDLVVANDEQEEPSTYRLYRQFDDARFEDVTEESGLSTYIDGHPGSFHVNRGGLCAGDVNNDGFLDLFSPLWNGHDHLFLNDSDGTFTDISESSNVGVPSTSYQGVMMDIDGNGFIDIYVALDAGSNRLWLNQGNLAFVESSRGIGRMANNKNDMGMAMGDFDNDLDFDFYITCLWSPGSNRHNVLIRNESTESEGLRFTEISQDVGVDYGGFGWGATFTDGDGDGWLDIAATNGFWGSNNPDPSVFYWNRNAGATFVNASDFVSFNDELYGSGLVTLDYDRDGDQDLLQTIGEGELRLLENRRLAGTSPPNYLVVRPRMAGANRFAIGAVITVETDLGSAMRLIGAGTSFLGQEPAEGHFGLGDAASVIQVEVAWPGGGVSVHEKIALNQVVTVFDDGSSSVSGRQLPGDGNQDGMIGTGDAVSLLSGLFLGTRETFPCGAVGHSGNRTLLDWQGDGSIDIFDPLALLFHLFRGAPAHSRSVLSGEASSCLPMLGCPTGPGCD